MEGDWRRDKISNFQFPISNFATGRAFTGFGLLDFNFFTGLPLCKKSKPKSKIVFLPFFTTQWPELVNFPITVASTPRRFIKLSSFFHLAGGTAKVMRSCDSLIQIC